MTYLEAALSVLRRAKRPMTTREVTERALTQGLITPRGKTPEATMSAVLYEQLRLGSALRKIAQPGTIRAKRGSVRWTVDSD